MIRTIRLPVSYSLKYIYRRWGMSTLF